MPEIPATTLDEAVNAVWIGWVGLHMESTNAGLSIGRLDQWLQPFFVSDMAKLPAPGEKARNAKSSSIDWRFTTDDARIKLKKLYPSFGE